MTNNLYNLMSDDVGFVLFQEIVKNEMKNGKDPWKIFVPIDINFITKHFGPKASEWAVIQRDLDMSNLINRLRTITKIKQKMDAKENEIKQKIN